MATAIAPIGTRVRVWWWDSITGKRAPFCGTVIESMLQLGDAVGYRISYDDGSSHVHDLATGSGACSAPHPASKGVLSSPPSEQGGDEALPPPKRPRRLVAAQQQEEKEESRAEEDIGEERPPAQQSAGAAALPAGWYEELDETGRRWTSCTGPDGQHARSRAELPQLMPQLNSTQLDSIIQIVNGRTKPAAAVAAAVAPIPVAPAAVAAPSDPASSKVWQTHCSTETPRTDKAEIKPPPSAEFADVLEDLVIIEGRVVDSEGEEGEEGEEVECEEEEDSPVDAPKAPGPLTEEQQQRRRQRQQLVQQQQQLVQHQQLVQQQQQLVQQQRLVQLQQQQLVQQQQQLVQIMAPVVGADGVKRWVQITRQYNSRYGPTRIPLGFSPNHEE